MKFGDAPTVHIPTYGNEAVHPQPAATLADGTTLPSQWGLTKREYFAVTILQGLVANPLDKKDLQVPLAAIATSMADSLLTELSK